MKEKIEINAGQLWTMARELGSDHLKLVVEIAHKSTEAEFVAFMQSGEISGVKLNASQMNALKGGLTKKQANKLAGQINAAGGNLTGIVDKDPN